MIAIPALLVVIAACVLLEHFVRSSFLRVTGVMLIILVSAVIAFNIGMKLGKTDQLNRFARLLPRVLTVLDQAKQQPESFNEAIRVLQVVTSDPAKLDNLEFTLHQLDERQAQMPGK